MIRKMSLTAVIPLAFCANFFGSPNVEAADRFGVVGIENATNVTVRLQHRWGDGQWATDVLSPGGRKWYWWEYRQANEDKSPPFNVRFDSDLSPGRFYEKYDLGKYRAPDHDWNSAHKYVFKYNGNHSFIELFDQK
jgi:hypothetical protein